LEDFETLVQEQGKKFSNSFSSDPSDDSNLKMIAEQSQHLRKGRSFQDK